MSKIEAAEAYAKALKEGQKEYKDCLQKKLRPHPLVLDELLTEETNSRTVGLVDIPIHRIVGTKSAGRISAFTPSFRPLLETDTEFAYKWISLCADHLGTEGIRDPIECYEYLGSFYVQEGNKRVSVLGHFGAARVEANVKRILPQGEETPRIKAYQEFLEFYKLSRLYDVQFTTPGGYGRLLEKLGLAADHLWTQEERRRFQSGFHYFSEALAAVDSTQSPEEALLLWLELHPYSDLMDLSTAELKRTVSQLLPNIVSAANPEPVVKTEPPEEKGILSLLLKGTDRLKVAFVHLYDTQTSPWTRAHEMGRLYVDVALGKSVTTLSYSNANTPELAAKYIDEAVDQGAHVVFTTAPQLISPCLKASVKYPKVRFFNCSVHQPYATVHTYYSRIYEGKFITGAVAGAMCRDGQIGYVGSYPIHGVPASINAFALGAQLTNPRARIQLKWSCLPGNPTKEFLDRGIQVISNRDTPVDKYLMNEYGTFMADCNGKLIPLSSPTWVWGQFYENVARSILSGSWEDDKDGQAVNLWWGMRSGVIDVTLARELPEGVRVLAEYLKAGICSGSLDPFKRQIIDQQGRVISDGSKNFTPMELLTMDWLCENVEGSFPKYQDILPMSRPMVDLLGIDPSVEETL